MVRNYRYETYFHNFYLFYQYTRCPSTFYAQSELENIFVFIHEELFSEKRSPVIEIVWFNLSMTFTFHIPESNEDTVYNFCRKHNLGFSTKYDILIVDAKNRMKR